MTLFHTFRFRCTGRWRPQIEQRLLQVSDYFHFHLLPFSFFNLRDWLCIITLNNEGLILIFEYESENVFIFFCSFFIFFSQDNRMYMKMGHLGIPLRTCLTFKTQEGLSNLLSRVDQVVLKIRSTTVCGAILQGI